MSLTTPYHDSYLAGNGSDITFGFSFEAISENYVKCIIYMEDGTPVVPSFSVNIAVGEITINSLTTPDGEVLQAPPVGSTIRIFRDVPEVQNATTSQLQAFTAKQLEKTLDNVVAMIQENKYELEHKTIRTTETERDVSLQALKEDNDEELLMWSEDEHAIVASGLTKKEWEESTAYAIETAEEAKEIAEEAKEIAEEAKREGGKVDDVQLNGVSVVEGKIANIEPVAGDIAYTNPQYPTMATLQDAMDKLLYVNPAVSVSGGGNYEIGSTRSSTKITWTWNKTIQSQSLNQGIGDLDPTVREYTYTTAITSDTTFTVTGSDGTKTVSGSTKVSFLPSRYWGVSEKTSLTDSEIIALSSELSTNRIQTRTFDCSGGKYFYFAIKTSYCSNIKFKVGGLFNTDFEIETRQFTNASGHTDSYNIYRIGLIQYGTAIPVEVL